jgi:starvation-inducible DNA-binding protein
MKTSMLPVDHPLPPVLSGALPDRVVEAISLSFTDLVADLFALYVKTKNFHWHMTGPHFRDLHLMLDEQAQEILDATDPMAERVRKLGGTTLRSIGHIGRQTRVMDNDADEVEIDDMLIELWRDNTALVGAMRQAHRLCDEGGDISGASLLEGWIDQAERRAWFLRESVWHTGLNRM